MEVCLTNGNVVAVQPKPCDINLEIRWWWRGLVSNQRRRKPTDLQSVPFSHSGTSPVQRRSDLPVPPHDPIGPCRQRSIIFNAFCSAREAEQDARFMVTRAAGVNSKANRPVLREIHDPVTAVQVTAVQNTFGGRLAPERRVIRAASRISVPFANPGQFEKSVGNCEAPFGYGLSTFLKISRSALSTLPLVSGPR